MSANLSGMGFGGFFQPTHLLFILVIALLVLGPKRLPEVAKTLGRGLRDFKDALNTDDLDWRHQPAGQSTEEREPRHELSSQSSATTVEPAESVSAAGDLTVSAKPLSEPAEGLTPESGPERAASAEPAAEPVARAESAKPAAEPIARGAD